MNEINVDTSGPYKYVSVKFKNEKEMEMKSADFFIFRENISLYRYDGNTDYVSIFLPNFKNFRFFNNAKLIW